MIKNKFALPITLVLLTAITALADKLVINSNQSNPVGKALFTKIVEDFKKQNPDLEVVFNTTDHEGYKTAIRNWLTTEPPDIVFWFSGNRMKAFVDRGLFDDVSDLWTKNKWDEEKTATYVGGAEADPLSGLTGIRVEYEPGRELHSTIAVAPKNWIHLGSPQAGPKVAAIFSIVETCRRINLPVRECLSAVLPGLVNMQLQHLSDLTPTAWVAQH